MAKKKSKKNTKKTTKKTSEEKTSGFKSKKTKTSKTGVFIALVIIAIVSILLILKFGESAEEWSAHVYINNEKIFLNEVTNELNNLSKTAQSELTEKSESTEYKKQLLTDISSSNAEAKKEIEEIIEKYEIDLETVADNLVIQSVKKTEDLGATIAVVNGNIIYESELNTEVERLPIEMQQALDQNAILLQLIDKKLLIYKAEEANVAVEDNIEEILATNEITIKELEANVNSQGFTLEEFKNQLKVFEFLDTIVFADLEVSDEEAESYYNDNIQQFTLPESVKTRHILVSTTTIERTDKEALAIMDKIEAALAEDETVFCDLVTEYSDDPGSKDSCGEYPAFSRSSNFVQEYKDAAFNNKVNEYSIVKTSFGYHLIQTLEKTPKTTLSFEEVKKDLKESLVFEKQKDVFAVYMEGLRADSEIINCLETPEAEACTDKTEKIIEGENKEFSDKNALETFTKCLSEKGAKMYGAYWCSHCNEQKEMFGDLFENIEYVECAEEDNPRVQTIACQQAEISGYPTWEINGQKYPGKQSFEALAKLSGCSL